jgi:hypothetical protein
VVPRTRSPRNPPTANFTGTALPAVTTFTAGMFLIGLKNPLKCMSDDTESETVFDAAV